MMTESLNDSNCWIQRKRCICGDKQCFIRRKGIDEDKMRDSQELMEPIHERSSELLIIDIVPNVGHTFQNDDDAYQCYCSFARKNGFSVRRHRSQGNPRHQLGIYRREYVCHRAGFAPPRKIAEKERQRDRKSSRCECQARMVISKDIKEGVRQWTIVHFSNVHNHDLLEDNEVQFLPAYRNISTSDHERILILSKAGCSVNLIMRVLELEKGVQPGHLPFIEKDVRNFIQYSNNVDRGNDAADLLKVCKRLKDKDADFSYDFTLDENHQLEHIAWSYGDSIRAYKVFGDVVIFDTTYRLSAYNMSLGVWVGVDNHGNTIFFGCVLLRNEKAHSFAWALQTFIRFMDGAFPQTILTEQDLGLKEAISMELPNTKHVLCIWHIVSKLLSWFASILGSQYAAFKTDFHKLYNLETVEEFETQWHQMVAHFGLSSDRHIDLLYSHRASWALPYIRGYFSAGMTKTGCSESINSFLKRFLSANTRLKDFIEQVGVAANFRIQAGEEATMRQKYLNSQTKTFMPIEEHASNILTPYAFNKLQNELLSSLQFAAIEISDGSYIVRHHTKTDGGHLVKWMETDEEIHCSCHEFECSGLLCRHILRVFTMKNYFRIPEKYLLTRWRREISLHSKDNQGSQSSSNDEWSQEFHSLTTKIFAESLVMEERVEYVKKELTRLLNNVKSILPIDEPMVNLEPDPITTNEVEDVNIEVNFVESPLQSKTKSRPKEKRIIGDFEEAKKTRRCHVPNCGGTGHDARNCPMK